MEYLMTYGWAILIIAVVLSVLFQLGVFSSGNFQPHAQAGACQVSRTVAGVSLEGQCNGMLPQYVAKFSGQAGSNVIINEVSQYAISGSISETVWVNLQSVGSSINLGIISSATQTYPLLFMQSGVQSFKYAILVGPTQYYDDSYFTPQTNKWYFVVGTYNQTTGIVAIYVNGVYYSSVQSNPPAGTAQTQYGNGWAIGSFPGQSTYTQAMMADVQIYNTTLSSAEVNALYLEGIGGAPIRPQNLVGWWPLNGNANDYSGNNNNGAQAGVTYSSSWESGYTPP